MTQALLHRLSATLLLIITLLAPTPAAAQTTDRTKPFPHPDLVLRDKNHKEPKSGVQLNGNQLTIASGVGTPTTINALSFSGDGNVLAAAKDFGRVVLWDLRGKKFLRALETGQGIVDAVAVSPDGKTAVTGGQGDAFSLKFWDIASGKLLRTWKESQSQIRKITYDASGQTMLVTNNSGLLFVFTLPGDQSPQTIKIRAAVMSQDAKSVIIVDEKEAALWSCYPWSKTRTIHSPPKNTLLVAADASGEHFATYHAKNMQIVSATSGETIVERSDFFPKNFTWMPTFASFSADGKTLYASMDGRAWLWRLAENQACSTSPMYSGSAIVSPDGRWFAAAKDDSILSSERTDGVRLWDTSHLAESCNSR